MKVGQTEPLPMHAVDSTRKNFPSDRSFCRTGIWPCAINWRTNFGSPASTPMAKSRCAFSVCLIQQFLRIDPDSIRCRKNARFQQGHGFQIVSPAHFGRFMVQEWPFKLSQQYLFLAYLSSSASDDAWKLSDLTHDKPALKHMQGATVSDKARVKLLPLFKVFMATRLVAGAVKRSDLTFESNHRLQ